MQATKSADGSPAEREDHGAIGRKRPHSTAINTNDKKPSRSLAPVGPLMEGTFSSEELPRAISPMRKCLTPYSAIMGLSPDRP